jgi:hypothetical protein
VISEIRSLPAVAGNLRLCFYSVILCILSESSFDRINKMDRMGSVKNLYLYSVILRILSESSFDRINKMD